MFYRDRLPSGNQTWPQIRVIKSFPVKFPPGPQDPAWEDLGPWRAPVETQPEDPSLDLKVSVNWTSFMLFSGGLKAPSLVEVLHKLQIPRRTRRFD